MHQVWRSTLNTQKYEVGCLKRAAYLSYSTNLGRYHFLTGGGPSVCGGGGPEFFGVVKGGGPKFFQWVKGGDQNFLRGQRGGDQNFSP